jgi:phosphoribosylaminoimidazolecarboxamide formyltransferase/IMP cyclohydrolase
MSPDAPDGRSTGRGAGPRRRALLSVYDKTGLVELAAGLVEAGWELVSSRSTARVLAEAGLPVIDVADVTGVPPILDHRVVTLHPKIHGGLLADRESETHRAELAEYGIEPFDLVVSNLYPFTDRPGIEMIDIGGPALVRAAAKNHRWVAVVTSPAQYGTVLDEIRAHGEVTPATRRALATEAFAHTAAYDAAVLAWLQADQGDDLLPRHLVLAYERAPAPLRYGENPHQQAARYRPTGRVTWWDRATQHGGVELSYLNLYDTEAAWRLAHDLTAHFDGRPVAVIVKHANPCGVAVAGTPAEAYARALAADERSAFGGVVAHSHPVDEPTATAMVAGPQADVVIAPAWDPGTLGALAAKRRNTRLLEAPPPEPYSRHLRQLGAGLLVQTPHHYAAGRDAWRVVTKASPTSEQWADAELAWRVCGAVTSNAVVLVRDGVAVGIGAGQQNRVQAAEIAAAKAAGRARGGACASDAFYPFPDGVEAAAAAGVAVVIQPGGSVRDEEVIRRADELGLAMVFTGERHFLH